MQYNLRDRRRTGEIENTVLLVEHPPVITLGASQSANKLLTSTETLTESGIDVVHIRRGGGSTAHNPGQIIFYPIFDLRQFDCGINEYIRELESIGTELLEQLQVKADRKKGFPGLWTGEKKIASIGVRVSKSITYHGMAINIKNDLDIFSHIIPCGLDGIRMTSAELESGKDYAMADVKKELSKIIADHFCQSGKITYEQYR